MYDFEYHHPATLAEAQRLLADDEDAKIIAGGMTLLPTMKMRLASPSALIDLSHIESLSNISDLSHSVEIGAMVTHADVAASDIVRSGVPVVADLAQQIGDAQVRNRGTIGGSVSNSDPAADYPAAVLGLNAFIKTDRREIAADDFFSGLFETALETDEIVTSIRFPKATRAAYAKFPNPASRYAVVGVLIAETSTGLRVAVTGAGPCAFRAFEIEAALVNNVSPDALDGIAIDFADFNEDLFASAKYRADLLLVMARNAISCLTPE